LTDGNNSIRSGLQYIGLGAALSWKDATTGPGLDMYLHGVGSHMDVSSGHRGVLGVGTGANRAADATQKVRTRQKRSKPPDSPIEAARPRSHEPNGCGSHAEAASAQTDAHSLETDVQSVTTNARTLANESRNIRTRRIGSRMQNSPVAHDIKLPEHTVWWRSVSAGEVDVYAPMNAPIETASRSSSLNESKAVTRR